MRNTTTFIQFTSFILLGLFLSSCGKKDICTYPFKTIYFRSADIEKVPYTSYDTLTFVCVNPRDTFTYIAGLWKTYFFQSSTVQQCSTTYNRPERDLQFRCEKIHSNLYLTQFVSDTFPGNSSINIYFNSDFFSKPSFEIYDSAEIPEMKVQGETYYFVNKISNIYAKNPTGNFCYYQKDVGIIRIETSDGKTWDRINRY